MIIILTNSKRNRDAAELLRQLGEEVCHIESFVNLNPDDKRLLVLDLDATGFSLRTIHHVILDKLLKARLPESAISIDLVIAGASIVITSSDKETTTYAGIHQLARNLADKFLSVKKRNIPVRLINKVDVDFTLLVPPTLETPNWKIYNIKESVLGDKEANYENLLDLATEKDLLWEGSIEGWLSSSPQLSVSASPYASLKKQLLGQGSPFASKDSPGPEEKDLPTPVKGMPNPGSGMKSV